MLTEELLMGMKSNAERGFDMYCRDEGIDWRYLLSNLQRKASKKRPDKKNKHEFHLPSIHIVRPN